MSDRATLGTIMVHECKLVRVIRVKDGGLDIELQGDRLLVGTARIVVMGKPALQIVDENQASADMRQYHGRTFEEFWGVPESECGDAPLVDSEAPGVGDSEP